MVWLECGMTNRSGYLMVVNELGGTVHRVSS
jgi:hypothetical protein